MKIRKSILITVAMLLGATFAFAVNYFFFEDFLIPDPCYYHNRDTTLLFDLFYDLPTSEGGHPFPTVFNLVVTLSAGALLGWYIATLIFRRGTRKKTAHNSGLASVGLDK